MWLGPPYMNRKMTLFAFGAKCGGLGASGLANRRGTGRGGAAEEAVASQHRRQRCGAEAGAGLPEELAPGAAAEC